VTTLTELLWNAEQRRLRAAVRIGGFFCLWLLMPLLLDALLLPWLTNATLGLVQVEGLWLAQGIHFAVYLLGVFIVTWLATRFLDRRPLADLGLHLSRSWWVDLAGGLALGALLMTLLFVVQWWLGWVVITGFWQVRLVDMPFVLAVSGPLMLFIAVAVAEELMFRGYLLRNLAEGFNTPAIGARLSIVLAWLGSSAFFGLLHVFNPNSSWISTLYLMVAGLMLGLAVVLTGSLALPIGLHITWNFFQGNIYGWPVSGNDFTGVTLIAVQQQGPSLWTGGRFGPEAGLLGLWAVALGCALIVWWVRSRLGVVRMYEPLVEYRARVTGDG
jgi:membrane protease YdiL (CAAX protease family)